MSSYSLIGIAGKKQSGKNTVANILRSLTINLPIDNDIIDFVKNRLIDTKSLDLYSKYKTASFAYPIKICASLMLNIPVEAFESEDFKKQVIPEFGITYRQFLQKLGTEVGRNIHPDIWVNYVIKQIGNKPTIITDVRFKNECDAIKNNNGLLICVKRNNNIIDTHLSEVELDEYTDFDYIIDNRGSIDELITTCISLNI